MSNPRTIEVLLAKRPTYPGGVVDFFSVANVRSLGKAFEKAHQLSFLTNRNMKVIVFKHNSDEWFVLKNKELIAWNPADSSCF